MRVIYIAGKFTGENAWAVEQNVRAAEMVGYEVAQLGAAPLIPHANTRFFVGTCTPEFWYEATLALLLKCDALVTVDNWRDSRGAVTEVVAAQDVGIPVFHSIAALKAWLEPREAGCGCPECKPETTDDEGSGF